MSRWGHHLAVYWKGWANAVVDRFDAWRESLAELETPVRAERLCRKFSEVLPADAIFVTDTGYSGIWTGRWSS